MAKKKRTKDSETKTFQYRVELNGLLLILIGLIGFGGFGPVGQITKNFAIFLMGNLWPVVLFFVLIIGFHMVFKRSLPKFFSARLIGSYILTIVLLVVIHLPIVEKAENSTDIFQITVDQFMERVSSAVSNISVGGGMIGAIISVIFSFLFDIKGMTIVLVVLTLFGLIMLFDITLSDVFNQIKKAFKWFVNKFKLDNEDDEDDRVIITDVNQLKIPDTKLEVEEEVQVATSSASGSNTYRLPPLSLLENPPPNKVNSDDFTRSNKAIIERVFTDFQISGKVVEISVGPAVTQYEIKITSGTKVNKILSVRDELKLALAVKDIRIQAPIPGKSTIGIEVPNPVISPVKIKEILVNVPKHMESGDILVSLGKDIMGRPQLADLTKMPHLLVAGSTGSGKSVCINSFIASILVRYRPEEVKLILVDPKKVELSNYNGIPHLLCPVVTDPKKASLTLQRVVSEMERRYNLFAEAGAKNISTYNDKIKKKLKKNPELTETVLPFYVVIIDELADLMLVASKEVEDSIMRITQMARAAGIHLIVATQRPSTDVITGVVKANIGSRISFAVASNIDSRTILDMSGAERLLGKGDMLYKPMGENIPIRIQGSFITDNEIQKLIDYVCKQQTVKYDETLEKIDEQVVGINSDKEEYDDPLYNDVVDFATKSEKISISLLQRRFRIGYNRAARIVDLLEERGIVGPPNGSKPREVLVKVQEENEKGS